MSMLKEMPRRWWTLQEDGYFLLCRRGRGTAPRQVFRDAYAGELKPTLQLHGGPADSLEGEPTPILPTKHIQFTAGSHSSFDLGRGCPFQCSFCTIINVQGRKSRFRSADDLERIIRDNYEQGIDRFFITDDNFARNRDWEELFDRLI
jgi:hypothetical protein